MDNPYNITVTKDSGEKVIFDIEKLKKSLKRSKASETDIKDIIDKIESSLYDGITTKEIYKKAFSFLKKKTPHTAARYKLKRAIIELGPTGFPFEKFVAELLKHDGFETEIGVIVEGQCVNHEVDVVATKGDKHFMVECKFHSDTRRFCNIKIPLYIQSRFKDVEAHWIKQPGHDSKFHQGWIVTNTRFTSDALKYGNCAGLLMISWDYPKNGSLKDRIDKAGLHPITSLTTITKHEKQQLLDKGIVLCTDLCKHPELLKSVVSKLRKEKILHEAHELCNN